MALSNAWPSPCATPDRHGFLSPHMGMVPSVLLCPQCFKFLTPARRDAASSSWLPSAPHPGRSASASMASLVLPSRKAVPRVVQGDFAGVHGGWRPQGRPCRQRGSPCRQGWRSHGEGSASSVRHNDLSWAREPFRGERMSAPYVAPTVVTVTMAQPPIRVDAPAQHGGMLVKPAWAASSTMYTMFASSSDAM